jgi:hypothetical protein
MAVVNIFCSIALTHRIGVPGVVYGSIIAQLLCFILPLTLLAPRFLRNFKLAPPAQPALEQEGA